MQSTKKSNFQGKISSKPAQRVRWKFAHFYWIHFPTNFRRGDSDPALSLRLALWHSVKKAQIKAETWLIMQVFVISISEAKKRTEWVAGLGEGGNILRSHSFEMTRNIFKDSARLRRRRNPLRSVSLLFFTSTILTSFRTFCLYICRLKSDPSFAADNVD